MQLVGSVLYVSDIAKSVEFYSDLFAVKPVHQSDDFALFELAQGQQLRLWQQDEVKPSIPDEDKGGVKNSCELAFDAGGVDVLNTLYEKLNTCTNILQPLCQMSFGKAFTATDPDGHRLRFMYVTVA